MSGEGTSQRLNPLPPHVRLILNEKKGGGEFYLEVPVAVAMTLVVKPLKYLRFLGWSVLGKEQNLQWYKQGIKGEFEWVPVENLDSPDFPEVHNYTYRYGEAKDVKLKTTVDEEVIKQRTEYSTSSLATRNNEFARSLKRRDGRCVFTALRKPVEGMHVIPFARGDEWLKLIVKVRKNMADVDESIKNLRTIDDIRNGLLVSSNVHKLWEDREVVILKTPNKMLDQQDVAPFVPYGPIAQTSQAYPHGKRYTLQWLVPESSADEQELTEWYIPNNRDAAFLETALNDNTHEPLPLPSGLLLHYNYGAAVVKHWGRNKAFLDLSSVPRPAKPVEPVSRPPRTRNDRTVVTRKLELARSAGEAGGSGTRNADEPNTSRRELDADEIVLALWLNNNPEALAEIEEEKQLAKESIMDWRAGVGEEISSYH